MIFNLIYLWYFVSIVLVIWFIIHHGCTFILHGCTFILHSCMLWSYNVFNLNIYQSNIFLFLMLINIELIFGMRVFHNELLVYVKFTFCWLLWKIWLLVFNNFWKNLTALSNFKFGYHLFICLGNRMYYDMKLSVCMCTLTSFLSRPYRLAQWGYQDETYIKHVL